MKSFGERWTLFLIGCVVLVGAAIVGLGGQVAAQEPDGAPLGVLVTRDGEAVGGVEADLYGATADGSRGAWLGGRRTGPDGWVRWSVPAGCYVVVLIAPANESFESILGQPVGGDGRYAQSRAFCLEDGIEFGAAMTPFNSSLVGTVTFASGEPASTVFADVFLDPGDGQRDEWLGSAAADANGDYRRGVGAGCYVVVLVAPAEATFTSSGSRYLQVAGCVERGAELRVDGVLAGSPAGLGTVRGTVDDEAGRGVTGVVADYFEAIGDGTRGTWLGEARSGADGTYTRQVEAGCYVVVLVAPEGRQFSPGGGRYRELAICVEVDQTRELPAVKLLGASCVGPNPVSLDANRFGHVEPWSIVTGSDGRIYFVGDDDTTVTDIWVYDQTTGQGANLGIPAFREPLIPGDGVLYHRGQSGRDIRIYDLSTGRQTTIATIGSQFFAGPVLVGDRLLWQHRGPVMMYDITTGQISERPEGDFRLGGSALGPDGRLYYRRSIGSAGLALAAIDLDTGENEVFDLAGGQGFDPNELTFGPGGRLFFASRLGVDGQLVPVAGLSSYDPGTGQIQAYGDITSPFSLTAGQDGRLYFAANADGSANLYAIDVDGQLIPEPVAIEPGGLATVRSLRPFGTGVDGRLYFAMVNDPEADSRLRAREIRSPLDTETLLLDGAVFVDRLHFSPDGRIYFSGFDGDETELFAHQPSCPPSGD